MSWYNGKSTRTALRKHMLRIDMRVYCGDPGANLNPNDKKSVINSMLMAAIINGLDVVGIVDHTPETGWMASQLAKQNQIDLWVVPGEEYQCNDKYKVVVYNLAKPLPPNLSVTQVCQHAHQNNGFVMVLGLTKRHAQNLNGIKGQPTAPDAVEIFNAANSSGYQNMVIEYPTFITSGAKNATELENMFAYTVMNRKEFEGLGLLPEGEGSEYVPKYLEREEEAIQNENQALPQPQPQQPTGV